MFIAREDYWDKRFKEAGLPIIGDDIKSQVGATIVHRQLARLFHERGVSSQHTSPAQRRRQHGLLQHARARAPRLEEDLEDERRHLGHGHRAPDDDVHVGPSDYVPWLTDRKWAHIRLEGKSFGDVPLNVELKLEVWDSPNSAGVVIDAVRLIKLALNNGIAGQLDGPSSYLMKSPHTQRPDDEAREQTEEFIAAHARTAAAARAKERGRDCRRPVRGSGRELSASGPQVEAAATAGARRCRERLALRGSGRPPSRRS